MVKPPAEPDEVQINARVPALMAQKITVAKGILGLTQTEIVNRGLVLFFEDLSAARRKLIDEAVAMRSKP